MYVVTYRDIGLYKKLKAAASDLNICKHHVKGTPLYSACDVEGHLDADNRYYLIDLARTFPPEHPDRAPHLQAREVGSTVLVRRSVFPPESSEHTGSPLASRDRQTQEAHSSSEWVEAVITAAGGRASLCPSPSQPPGTDSSADEARRFSSFDVCSKKYGTVTIDCADDLAQCKKCIFWRFLRPEFLKHRGRALIAAHSGDASRMPGHKEEPPPTAPSEMELLGGEADSPDVSALPPINPLLRKATSSTYSAMSGGPGGIGDSDEGSTDHVYNCFFLSADSVSAHENVSAAPRAGGVSNVAISDSSALQLQASAAMGSSCESHAGFGASKPAALSSDALADFSRDDPDRAQHNRNVETATDILVSQLVPAMVSRSKRICAV